MKLRMLKVWKGKNLLIDALLMGLRYLNELQYILPDTLLPKF